MLVVILAVSVWKCFFFSLAILLVFFCRFTFEKLIINDGRHSERLRRDANYENALEEAEKERKEINYGNYLACLPSRTPCRASSSFGDVCISGLWFDLFKFFLRYFLFFSFWFSFFWCFAASSDSRSWQDTWLLLLLTPPANNNLFSLICALTPSRLAALH